MTTTNLEQQAPVEQTSFRVNDGQTVSPALTTSLTLDSNYRPSCARDESLTRYGNDLSFRATNADPLADIKRELGVSQDYGSQRFSNAVENTISSFRDLMRHAQEHAYGFRATQWPYHTWHQHLQNSTTQRTFGGYTSFSLTPTDRHAGVHEGQHRHGGEHVIRAGDLGDRLLPQHDTGTVPISAQDFHNTFVKDVRDTYRRTGPTSRFWSELQKTLKSHLPADAQGEFDDYFMKTAKEVYRQYGNSPRQFWQQLESKLYQEIKDRSDMPTPPNPGDVPPNPGGGDNPGDVSDMPKATPEQLRAAEKLIRNVDASPTYIQEVKQALAQMPQSMVEGFINRGAPITLRRNGGGVGGTYNTYSGEITLYESAKAFGMGAIDVLAAEGAHHADLGPGGLRISSQPWFREAYNKVVNSGVRVGGNFLENPIEMVMAYGMWAAGVRDNASVNAIINAAGPDTLKRVMDMFAKRAR